VELKLDKRFNQQVTNVVLSDIAAAFHMLYTDAMGDRLSFPASDPKIMAQIIQEKADCLKQIITKFVDLQSDVYWRLFTNYKKEEHHDTERVGSD
jgi:hypothetical protein